MKEYSSENIRNVALVSHSSAGKTMLAEAMLHFTGGTTRLGAIEDGTTASDFDEEEVRRGISLSSSVIPVEYRGTKINLVDTPGYVDFIGEVISALRVVDGAVVLVDASSGIEVGTEVAWSYCDQFNLPRFVLINKMNRDNANYQATLASLRGFSATRLLPLQLPWGEKQNFRGVIDLLSMKAYAGDGKKAEEVPDEFAPEIEAARMEIVEAAAEGDDSLLEKYLEGAELSAEEIMNGLRNVVFQGSFVPVFIAAGGAEIGIAPLLEAITSLLPSPVEAPATIAQGKSGDEELKASDSGPLAAYVWKTTADPFVGKITYFRIYSGALNSDSRIWNQTKGAEERLGTIYTIRGREQSPIKIFHSGDIGIVPKLGDTSTGDTLCDRNHPITLPVPLYPKALYRVAVSPATQADSAKLTPTLTRLCEEDMTLSWNPEPSTRQTILKGMGDQHIDVAIKKAEAKFQISIKTEEPRVPYQETITKSGFAQYRHKKQTGGAGQFAEVHMRVEPLQGENYEFSNEVFGGAISHNFMPAIDKGVQSVMRDGVLAGYPVVHVKAAVVDGKEHPVDSKPVAFEIAAREAFKAAFHEAAPVLLEPIMNVSVTVPEAKMGDVLGDLNTRRARVQGMDTDRGRSVVTATVPMAEMMRYTADLRSITGGRGVFLMDFAHYETVPAHIAQDVIDARKRDKATEKTP
ncbi:MAG TPA: elongation factor G [Anaerolineales bacterium]|nr:elongation factor G [Anaerolineales bacterium]